MSTTIAVAGATGNLGRRICTELRNRGAGVRAIVRAGSNTGKLEALRTAGVDVLPVDWSDDAALVRSVSGASCLVSALAGLQDVIVDAQLRLLRAALSAGMPRFIPSDFSTDFRAIPAGENRNFDLRKTFQKQLDASGIGATSIFNGTFADILRYNIPLFNVPERTIATCEGKTDWKIDFTTVDNTAAFTAAAALDDSAPRVLRIASFRVSPADLLALSGKYKGDPFRLVDMGALEDLSTRNKALRALQPAGEAELYPKWQQLQYIHSMFSAHHEALDNDRYSGIDWSPAAHNI